MVEIIPLSQVAPDAIEALLDAAFGSDRFGRTAYRLRAGVNWLAGFSVAATEAGQLVGTLQCWPVALTGAADERIAPLMMVGPVAVDPEWQGRGIGRQMMDHVIARADAAAPAALMMIGDPEYYGRFWGFSADETGAWRLPGPVEARRLLARAANGHAVPAAAGLIAPDHSPC